MRAMMKLIAAAIAILVIVACAPTVRGVAPFGDAAGTQPAPLSREYRIQAGDQLEIKFFYNPELSEQIVVRPDGRITLQLAPEIIAAGLTPAELVTQLKSRYAGVIKTAEIAVIVRSFTNQRVFIDGEVVRPGLLTLTNDMTVMQAVSQGGGFKDTARRGEILVIRRAADGTTVATVVNADRVLDRSDLSQDIPLLPFDIVYVPKTIIANVDVWIDQYLRRIVPIPIGMGFSLN